MEWTIFKISTFPLNVSPLTLLLLLLKVVVKLKQNIPKKKNEKLK